MSNTKAKKIVGEIKTLLDELLPLIGEPATGQISREKPIMQKGASGALTMLTNEGFFDSPKDISSIMGRLKEIGRYHPQTAVSMNLLNLAKRRKFDRLEDKKTKNWLYVIRK